MLKNFLLALILPAILLVSSTALAAFEENIAEDVDLTTIKKLAVAYPNYYKLDEKEPDIDELTNDLAGAGKLSSKLDIISYAEIAAAIRRDTGVELSSLKPTEAAKLFNKHVSKYADAYLVETVSNGAGRPWIFFYVYNAADNALLYTYSVQSHLIGKNTKDYYKAAEGFYKQFAETAGKSLSKEDKKKLEEQKRFENTSKKKMKKVTYKTGKSKEDLVKKK